MRVTDEQGRPPSELPPELPRRPASSRRDAARTRRQWAHGARVSAASPVVTRVIVLVALAVMLFGVGIVAVQRFGAPDATDTSLPGLARDASDSAEAAERRAFAARLFGDEIHDVVDHRDFEPEPQWRNALEVMAGLEDDFIAKNVRFSLNRHFDEVMKDPEAFRGQFVRMHGLVGKSFRAFKLTPPIAGRGDFYRGQVADESDDSPVVIFDLLDRPEELDKGYDTVDIDAVFYRMVEYEAQPERGKTTGEIRRAPWIIAKSVRVIRAPARTSIPTVVGLAVIVGFLALFFGIVYLVRRGPAGKTPGVPEAGFRNMFEQRRQQPPRTEGEEPPGL